jgi:hypothetical protein
MEGAPGYWMHETSGVLRPAVTAYLNDEPLTGEHVAALRAYLRQWIFAPMWRGEVVEELRGGIDSLTSRQAISDWLWRAQDEGIDPL